MNKTIKFQKKEIFFEYFQLFMNSNEAYNVPVFRRQFECEKTIGNYTLSEKLQKFSNFKSFCDYCLNRLSYERTKI